MFWRSRVEEEYVGEERGEVESLGLGTWEVLRGEMEGDSVGDDTEEEEGIDDEVGEGEGEEKEGVWIFLVGEGTPNSSSM